jgi:hypothetical protein
MPCHPSDFSLLAARQRGANTRSLQQLAKNNVAAMCVQLPKTIPQKRNGIIELLQHFMRQLCQITPQLRQITPQLSQNTPQLLHKS